MPDGLSFSGYNPRIKGSFFIHEEKWNSHDSYLKQVEDFFFAHDFLSCTFKRFYVVQAHSDYTLVPLSLFLEKKADELYAFTFGPAAERQVLYQSVFPEIMPQGLPFEACREDGGQKGIHTIMQGSGNSTASGPPPAGWGAPPTPCACFRGDGGRRRWASVRKGRSYTSFHIPRPRPPRRSWGYA